MRQNKSLKKRLLMIEGYTLIELLAVISILVVLTGIITGIIFSTLQGSSRTKKSTQVSQNGVYAASLIQGIISDSRNITQIDDSDIDDCTTDPTGVNSITLKRLDGNKTRLSCELIDGVYTVASNGASLIDTASVKVTSCNFYCSQVVQDPYSIPIVSVYFNLVGLTDPDTASGFSASAASSLRVYNP